jgi:hypothetical protein
MTMAKKRVNEADAYRCDVAETSTTSAPTDAARASHAVQTPESHRTRTRCHLRLKKTIASGTNTLQVKVWGRQTRAEDSSGVEQADDVWLQLYDTGPLSSSGNLRLSYLLEGAQDFEDLVTEVVTNGGTTPVLNTWFAFAGSDPN